LSIKKKKIHTSLVEGEKKREGSPEMQRPSGGGEGENKSLPEPRENTLEKTSPNPSR